MRRYYTLIYLEKASNKISKEVVHCRSLRKRKVPEKLIRLVDMMYDGSEVTVRMIIIKEHKNI